MLLSAPLLTAQDLFYFCRLYAALSLTASCGFVASTDYYFFQDCKTILREYLEHGEWLKMKDLLNARAVRNCLAKYPTCFKSLNEGQVQAAFDTLCGAFDKSLSMEEHEKAPFRLIFKDVASNLKTWFKLWHAKVINSFEYNWVEIALEQTSLEPISKATLPEHQRKTWAASCCVWLTQCFMGPPKLSETSLLVKK